MRRRLPACLCAALALAGCSLEPGFDRPAPAIPSDWPAGDAYLRSTEAALPTVTYREIFGDPQLQAIIEQAVAHNQDLRLASANVAAARAQYRVQRANILPAVDGTAGVSISDMGAGSDTAYSVDVGLSSFELDLFGRIRSLNDAALAEYFATEGAARAARLALVAEVASAYLTLAADRTLLAVAAETEASATRSVQLTEARRSGGIAPRSDVRQAETILAQARSDRAELTTAVAQDRNALELLVGAPVGDEHLPKSIDAADRLLRELPVALDSGVLLRRPDVLQAEYRLRAANARIGAARAAFFPRIGLTALTGLSSSALSSLFSGGAFNWSVQPSATIPLFEGGALSGNVAYAKAQRDAATANYQRAIQSAFREVADALARRGTINTQLAALTDLETAARDNLALEQARYREGIVPFLNILDAQRTLYQARRSLAATRLIRADNLVTLYRALGGDRLLDASADVPPIPRPAP